MAVRRMYNMFKGFSADMTFARNDNFATPEAVTFLRDTTFANSGTFADKATIKSVHASQGATISFRGEQVQAMQATDEPLRAGQEVWVSKARTGEYVILGTVR